MKKIISVDLSLAKVKEEGLCHVHVPVDAELKGVLSIANVPVAYYEIDSAFTKERLDTFYLKKTGHEYDIPKGTVFVNTIFIPPRSWHVFYEDASKKQVKGEPNEGAIRSGKGIGDKGTASS